MKGSIRVSLHLVQTDLATMEFVFFIFALALARVTWVVLRLLAGVLATADILSLVSGIAPIDALPLLWSYGREPWPSGWYLLEAGDFMEAGLVFVGIFLISAMVCSSVGGRLDSPGLLCNLGRESGFFDDIGSGFRYQVVRMCDLFIPAGAPVACIIAFVSSIVWVSCIHRSRRALAPS